MLVTANIKVEEHIGLAHAVASQFVLNPKVRVKDSEEYAEACLLLVQAAEDYDPNNGPFPPFAWAKMRNGLVDWHRKRNRQKRVGKFAPADLSVVPDRETEETAPVSKLLASVLADDPSETAQERADKLLLIEVYLCGTPVPEVATRLGVTREAIYQKLRKVMGRLRDKHAGVFDQYEVTT